MDKLILSKVKSKLDLCPFIRKQICFKSLNYGVFHLCGKLGFGAKNLGHIWVHSVPFELLMALLAHTLVPQREWMHIKMLHNSVGMTLFILWHIKTEHEAINGEILLFYSTLITRLARLNPELGVVKTSPTFWPDILISGGPFWWSSCLWTRKAQLPRNIGTSPYIFTMDCLTWHTKRIFLHPKH